jgi:hypothetical protein
MLQAKAYEHVSCGTNLIFISGTGIVVVATCTKCGTENVEGAKYCVNCGASLGRMERRERRPRDECFGLPHGGAIFGLFIGALIILWGLSEVFGWEIEIWTYAIIIIGLIIVAGAIYGLTRRGS